MLIKLDIYSLELYTCVSVDSGYLIKRGKVFVICLAKIGFFSFLFWNLKDTHQRDCIRKKLRRA